MREALRIRLRRILGPTAYWRVRRWLDRFLRHRTGSHAQFGEDLFLARYFGSRRDGTYVDVGAFHPRRFSNTYLLYRRGWRGVNVDATPGSMRLFRSVRPRDVNVEAAVSDSLEPVRFHSWGLHAENTFEPRQVRAVIDAQGPPEAVIEMAPRTLTEILDGSELRDRPIDLLSVDVEGSDLAVLRSLDFARYRPRIVIVESFHRGLEALLGSKLYALLSGEGYRLVAWHRPSVIFEWADGEGPSGGAGGSAASRPEVPPRGDRPGPS